MNVRGAEEEEEQSNPIANQDAAATAAAGGTRGYVRNEGQRLAANLLRGRFTFMTYSAPKFTYIQERDKKT